MEAFGLCVKLIRDNRVIGVRGFRGNIEFSHILKNVREFVIFYIDSLSTHPLSERYFIIHFFHLTLNSADTWSSHYEIMSESLKRFDAFTETKTILSNRDTIDPSSVIGLTVDDMMSIILNSKRIIEIDVDEKTVKLDTSMFIHLYIDDYKKHFDITDNDFNIEMFPIIETKIRDIPFKKVSETLHAMSVNMQGFRISERDKKIFIPVD